jgi:hypothetical protein
MRDFETGAFRLNNFERFERSHYFQVLVSIFVGSSVRRHWRQIVFINSVIRLTKVNNVIETRGNEMLLKCDKMKCSYVDFFE